MNTGVNSEKEFELRLKRKFGKNVLIYRVTDSKEVRGRSGKKVSTKPQPSDYVITECGTMYYAEVKSSQNKTSFPFGQISSTQLGYAKRQRMASGFYYFFLHNLNTDQWYKVPAAVILDHDKKSLKWDELQRYKWS